MNLHKSIETSGGRLKDSACQLTHTNRLFKQHSFRERKCRKGGILQEEKEEEANAN